MTGLQLSLAGKNIWSKNIYQKTKQNSKHLMKIKYKNTRNLSSLLISLLNFYFFLFYHIYHVDSSLTKTKLLPLDPLYTISWFAPDVFRVMTKTYNHCQLQQIDRNQI